MSVVTDVDVSINEVDQSEKYKMMCLRAKDLWDGRPFQEGDLMLVEGSEDEYRPSREHPEFAVTESIDGIHIVSRGRFIRREHTYTDAPSPTCEELKIDYLDFFDAVICMSGTFAWLPTKEQLKKELNKINEMRQELGDSFDCKKAELDTTIIPLDSVEQVLLNQLMREKFGESWDGKDWEPIYKNLNPLTISANHNKAWGSVREYLITRDGGECNICKQKPDKELHVHHKNGNSLDNRLENLLLVCNPCHRGLHKELREIANKNN